LLYFAPPLEMAKAHRAPAQRGAAAPLAPATGAMAWHHAIARMVGANALKVGSNALNRLTQIHCGL